MKWLRRSKPEETRPPQAPPTPPPPPPEPALPPQPEPAPPPPPTMSRDEAMEVLRQLRAESPTTWAPTDPGTVVASLRRMRDIVFALGLDTGTYEALARGVEHPDDAAAMFGAGYELIDVGIPDLAIAPLSRSLELLPAHGPTLDELSLALESANRPDESARLLLAHPSVLAERDSTRALCSHFAAMAGDLESTRRLAEQMTPGGQLDYFRPRALARCARADALARVTPLDGGDLRGWEAVLNGTVVLDRSDFGDDTMNGRYGALWDDPDRFRRILAVLSAALSEAGRAPTRVVAGADRDSQVVGWALATTLGLGAPVPPADATPGGFTLAVLYDWQRLDQEFFDRFFGDHDAVAFAYNLNWTTGSSMAPDVVGLQAQALFPAWGQRMRAIGEPGQSPVDVVDIPADDREPQVVGTELAATAGVVPADAEPVLGLVRALRTVADSVGMFGGYRDRFYPDGPVGSARFM